MEKENFALKDFRKGLVFKHILDNEIDNRNIIERRGEWDDKKIGAFRRQMQNPEQARIESDRIQVEIVDGTTNALSRFISKEPQMDAQSRLRYLLTSGLAVEVITGISRFHHDTDLVIFDYRNKWWTKYITDNVTSDKYWAEMKFDPEYLEKTAWQATFTVNGREHEVSTVHPAIILVQKLSDAWGRPPRERDYSDVNKLVTYWKKDLLRDQSWLPVIETAILALPLKEQAKTKQRLQPFFSAPKPDTRKKLLGLFPINFGLPN